MRGSLAELARYFAARPALGEVTLVIDGSRRLDQSALMSIDHRRIVEVLREAGLSLKDACAAASKLTGVSRRELYQSALSQAETLAASSKGE